MKFKVFRFKKVKSTNNTAIRIIKNNDCNFGMILSEIQTGGKGQYGRKWISYKGNLFVCFFYNLDNFDISISKLTKVNCMIVKKLLSKYYKKKIDFKKPNDLMVKEKKICGILQETIINAGKKFLIVGIGINTNLDPKNSSFSSTSLKHITNKNIDNKKLFIMIKKNYEKLLFKANQNSFSELKKFTQKI